MATTVAKLVAIIGADTRDLDDGLKKADQSLQRAGSRMQSIGQALTVGVSLPLAAAGVAAVKTAMDFEQTLNVFKATSGATAAQMGQVSKMARQLGADMTLPNTSAKDAVEAMLEMNKAGMSLADTMDSAKGVLQLSAAAQISNAQAAEITANALNAFGMAGSQAVRVADLLAAAAKSSSGEITDHALAMQMSASVFAQAKVPIEDLVTAISMMANAGIMGSDAGTSLKVMMLRLMAPTAQASQAIQDLGVRIYDANGVMLPMREIVSQFSQALGGMNQQQQAVALSTIFGTDAIRAANIVLAQGVEAWDKQKAATTQGGVAAELAAAQNAGLKGAIDGLKSALETLATSPAVMTLIKFLTYMVRAITALVNLLGLLPEPLQIAAIGLASMAAAAGPLLYVIAGIVRMLPELRAGMALLGAAGIGRIAGQGAMSGWTFANPAAAAAGGMGARGIVGGLGAAGLGARALGFLKGAGGMTLAATAVEAASRKALGYLPQGAFRAFGEGSMNGNWFGLPGQVLGGLQGLRNYRNSQQPAMVNNFYIQPQNRDAMRQEAYKAIDEASRRAFPSPAY